MLYKLKNNGSTPLVFGDLIINQNDIYTIYDSDLDLYGNLFKSLRDNFTSEREGDFLYYKDDVEYNLPTFYSDITTLFNNPIINTFGDGQNYSVYYLVNIDKKYLTNNPTILPSSINYKIDIKKLYRELTFSKGILIKAEYFKDITITQDSFGLDVYIYTNPILKCEYEYHIDNEGYVSYRHSRRYWTYIDNTYSTEVKEGLKYYTKIETREEAIRRRNNLVNNLLMSTVALLLYTDSNITTLSDAETATRSLLGAFNSDIDTYCKGFSEPLITNITNINEENYLPVEFISVGGWLSNLVPDGGGITIREYILAGLTDGMLIPNEIITI